MLVLALDTTTRAGSCALARNGTVLRETAGDPEQSHAQHLPGDLIALLEQEATPLDTIDSFAVAIGPGSFTGLRVGIATMQGLAFATGKPLIGISALDALARAGRARSFEPVDRGRSAEDDPPCTTVDTTATWVDAWRGEVYAALYEGEREIEPPSVELPEQILARLASRVAFATARPAARVGFIGDGAWSFRGAIARTLGAHAVMASPPTPLLAGAIAQLATVLAQAGHRPRPDAIRPLYVRRTDAELARDARTDR